RSNRRLAWLIATCAPCVRFHGSVTQRYNDRQGAPATALPAPLTAENLPATPKSRSTGTATGYPRSTALLDTAKQPLCTCLDHGRGKHRAICCPIAKWSLQRATRTLRKPER